MDNGSDGSITIDTALDNTGFEKGADKLLKSVQDLTNAVDNLGDNMMQGFSKVTPLLQSIANSAAAVNAKMTAVANETAAANDQVFESIQRVSQAAGQSAQSVSQQGEKTAESQRQAAQAAEQATGAFEARNGAMGGVALGTDAAQVKVSALEKEINALASSMSSISTSAETGFSTGNAVLSFEAKLAAISEKLTAAKAKLEEFGNTKIPTAEYTEFKAQIDKVEQALFKLYDRRDNMQDTGVKTNSRQWKSLALQIKNTEAELARYERGIQGLETNGKAFIQGADTEEYVRMKSALDNAGASLERNRTLIDAEALAQARLNVQIAQEQAARASTSREQDAASTRLRASQQELNNLASSMSGKAAPSESAISGWQRFGAALKTAGSAAIKVAATLGKVTFGAITTGIKTAVGKLREFVAQSRKTAVSARGLVKALTSLKTMLFSRVKRMFISAIMDSVKENMQALAQFSSAFNASMSSIKNSTAQLSGNVSVALSGLINAIAPVITKIIDMVSTAISYISALFAMLGGKSTITVAKKRMDSYAQSTGGAAKTAEELKNQVYGFDELNKRSSGSSSDGGGGGGGANPKDLFEEAPIESLLPDKVQLFFDRIKKAIEDGDWYGLGGILADKLNELIKAVDDWINNVFRPEEGVKWAKRIAQVLNGLTDGLNWELLGKTLADGLNAVFDIINTFLKEYDFSALGDGLGRMLSSFFENVEWDLIGETFANGWNALINIVYGIVTNKSLWTNIGNAIAEFVNSFAEELKLQKAAKAVAEGINGVITALQIAVDGIRWEEITLKIGMSINDLFTTIEWGDMGRLLADGFNEAVDFLSTLMGSIRWTDIAGDITEGLNNAINGVEWDDLGQLIVDGFNTAVSILNTTLSTFEWGETAKNIGTGLDTAITGIDWTTIGDTLESGLNGILDALIGFTDGFDFCEVASSIVSGIGKAIAAVNWLDIIGKALIAAVKGGAAIGDAVIGIASGAAEGMGAIFESLGWDCIAGFFKGFSDKLKGISDWLHEHFIDPVVDGIKSLFGINLIDGLYEGISDTWKSITDFFSDGLAGWKKTLSDAWGNIKTTASTAWGNIKTAIKTPFEGTKKPIESTADCVRTTLGKNWEGLKTAAGSTWDKIKTAVTTPFEGMKKPLEDTSETIKTTLSDNWDSVKTTAESKWATLKTDVEKLYDGLRVVLQSVDWKSIGSNLVSGVQKGISNAWGGFKSWVTRTFSEVIESAKSTFGVHSPSTVFAAIGENLIEGLQNGIEDKEKGAIDTVSNLANAMGKEMAIDDPSIQISGVSVVSGLSAVADKLSGVAKTFRLITDSLTAIGGFQMPQIAAGTVIPYQVKAAAMATPESDSSGIDAFSRDVDEQLSSIAYNQMQIMDILRKLNLNIDMEALSQAVTAQQRRTGRSYGGA